MRLCVWLRYEDASVLSDGPRKLLDFWAQIGPVEFEQ